MRKNVVITGMGAVTPLGVGARTLYERWLAGQSGIEDGLGRASEFDPTDFLSIKEARRADRFSQMAIVAGDEAFAEAGWEIKGDKPYDSDLIGCVIGTGIGGINTLERGKEILIEQGEKKVPPLSIPLMMPNAVSGTLSLRYGLHGNSFGTVSACSAGAHAIGIAARLIQSGDADAVVTGGSESAMTPLSIAAFKSLDALSQKGISRPFDARRDGFVMGEGAAILILEDEEKARARGAKILGYIRGFGASSDANHLTAPEPNGVGAMKAMKRALEDAGAAPEDVVYVNAHGTSTPLNDRAETKAIKMAFGEHAKDLKVSSLKSATGHLLGAAGAVEAVATVLALRDRMAPPTLNYEEAEEGMDLNYVPNEAQPLDIGDRKPLATSNAFGFGGHNVVLALEAA
jgi:3-oxoacyl-[acyl-carrier-protein] synthase II